MMGLKSYLLWMFAVGLGLACLYPTPGLAGVSIEVILGTNVAKEAVSGRLYVLMNSDTVQLPLYGPNLSDPQPLFIKDVSCKKHLKQAVELRPDSVKYLESLMSFYLHAPGIAGGDKKEAERLLPPIYARDHSGDVWPRKKLPLQMRIMKRQRMFTTEN